MSKPKLNRTYSSYTDDIRINRATQTRRDDDIIRTPKVDLYDVDYALLSYIRDTIKPHVTENNREVPIPVFFANAESWSQIQRHGYIRDNRNKLMTPVMILSRDSVTERPELAKLDVNLNPDINLNPEGNTLTFKSRFNKNNQYDRFSALQNIRHSETRYYSVVPEFVEVIYNFMIWTEYTEQMNRVISEIFPTAKFAWGTTWKFITYFDGFDFETVQTPGEDRIVRATAQLRVHAQLLASYELYRSNLEKRFTPKKLVFTNENIITDIYNKNT